jgi:hypothetical protein
MSGSLYADYLTITAGSRHRSGYEHYEQWMVMCPDDEAGEWFIYGTAEGLFDEVQGPFSTRAGALHCLRHAVQRICPREAHIID